MSLRAFSIDIFPPPLALGFISRSSNDVVRYERYKRVAESFLEHQKFSLTEPKNACPDEKPAFVTRLAGELARDGFLEKSGSKSTSSFRWNRNRDDSSIDPCIDSKIFGARISRVPLQDRPRERLLVDGAVALRTADLITILVRSGRPGESAVQPVESCPHTSPIASRNRPMQDGAS